MEWESILMWTSLVTLVLGTVLVVAWGGKAVRVVIDNLVFGVLFFDWITGAVGVEPIWRWTLTGLILVSIVVNAGRAKDNWARYAGLARAGGLDGGAMARMARRSKKAVGEWVEAQGVDPGELARKEANVMTQRIMELDAQEFESLHTDLDAAADALEAVENSAAASADSADGEGEVEGPDLLESLERYNRWLLGLEGDTRARVQDIWG